jgi:deoxyribodipyrimidine photolyase-related protein
LVEGDEPLGGGWNLDKENRERPPSHDGDVDYAHVYHPREDDIDAEVRADLRRLEAGLDLELYGGEGPRRYAVTRAEALRALSDFIDRRLDGFGPLEYAVVDGQPFLWHSLLSSALNVGLLHP